MRLVRRLPGYTHHLRTCPTGPHRWLWLGDRRPCHPGSASNRCLAKDNFDLSPSHLGLHSADPPDTSFV